MMGTAAVLLAALLVPQQDQEWKKKVERFHSRSNKTADVEKKLRYIGQISNPLNSRIIPVLAERIKKERKRRGMERVLIEIMRLLAQFPKQKGAADAVGEFLLGEKLAREYASNAELMVRALQSLSSINNEYTRPHFKAVHQWVRHRKVSVSKAAVEALAFMRVSESIDPLIAEMVRVQKYMKNYLGSIGTSKDCDGG